MLCHPLMDTVEYKELFKKIKEFELPENKIIDTHSFKIVAK